MHSRSEFNFSAVLLSPRTLLRCSSLFHADIHTLTVYSSLKVFLSEIDLITWSNHEKLQKVNLV